MDYIIDRNHALGYSTAMAKDTAASRGARAMAKRSVQARKAAWGEKEFNRRMREIGKLGGRPKGSTKKQTTREKGKS